MRKVLKSHNPSKGNDWRNQPEHILVENLFEEIHEFEMVKWRIRNGCFIPYLSVMACINVR